MTILQSHILQCPSEFVILCRIFIIHHIKLSWSELQLPEHHSGTNRHLLTRKEFYENQTHCEYDYADVRGQENVKRALDPEDIAGGGLKGISKKVLHLKETAEELGVGELTLKDIVQELEKPARDPRDEMPKPVLRSDVLDMKDLTPGMVLTFKAKIEADEFLEYEEVYQDRFYGTLKSQVENQLAKGELFEVFALQTLDLRPA